MIRNAYSLVILFVLVVMAVLPAEAQRRGGGRSGFSRPSGISRSSGAARSVSRPTPQYRGQPSYQRSSVPQNLNRGSLNSANINRNNINRNDLSNNFNRGNFNRDRANSNTYNRSFGGNPSRSQLDSFLSSSNRSEGRSLSVPSNLPAPSGGWNSKTFETANGGKITVGGGAGSKTGSGGGQVGGAAKGIKIETAGGKTITKGGVVAGGRDSQGNKAAGGIAGGKASDGRGNSIGGVRGGAVDNQGNYRGGVATGSKNSWGYARMNSRSVAGNTRTGNSTRVSRSAVRGPYGNVISTGRGGSFVNGQFVGGKTWTSVNGRYTRWNYFGPNYWVRYPGAWWPGRWYVGTAWWVATWQLVGPYCGFNGSGIYYDYGNNVLYEDNSVTYEGNKIATAEEYYEAAGDIADDGKETKDDDWMPLGVFALVKDPDQTETEKVIQLALNRDGAIRGNLHDLLTEDVKKIVGSVQKETQRVALKIEGNDDVVLDVGLYNLTNDEVPVLIHFSKDRRIDAMLVRLKNPDEKQPEDQPTEK